MTKNQLAAQLSKKRDYPESYVFFILTDLEELGLIKFDSERESLLKEAQQYIGPDCFVPLSYDNTAKLVKIIQRFSDLCK